MKNIGQVIDEAVLDKYDLVDVEDYRRLKQEYMANPVRKRRSDYLNVLFRFIVCSLSFWFAPIGLVINLFQSEKQAILPLILFPFVMMMLYVIIISWANTPCLDALYRIFRKKTTIGVFFFISITVYLLAVLIYAVCCLIGVAV